MSKYKAVIFDLDGTLLDTIEDITDSVNAVLKRRDKAPITIANIMRYVGLVVDNLIKDVISESGLPFFQLEGIREEYLTEYELRRNQKTRPYPGIEDLLAKMQANHIAIAVLSNKPDRDVREIIKHYFPTIDFAYVMGKRSVFPAKPDPASVRFILSELRMEKDEVLYIGDSQTDIETAANAGLESVGVLWGFRKETELREAHADHIVSHAEAIWDLVGRTES